MFNRHKSIISLVDSMIANPPKMHDWGKGPTLGGLEGDISKTLSKYLIDEFGPSKFRSLETGSGFSTLIFAACDPASHTTINPDSKLKDRIFSEMGKLNLSLDKIKYELAFSEDILPSLTNQVLDLVLIDGGHGWPSVFVDFCYTNMMLRKGGIMIVDDIQLYPCTQLYLLLKHQEGWELENIVYAKTAFFRKKTDARRMPDFGGQPFLMNNIIMK